MDTPDAVYSCEMRKVMETASFSGVGAEKI